LAEQPRESSFSAKDLADFHGFPQEALAKILQRLARTGLLLSHHGIKGGYSLARDPHQISVLDVIKAIQEIKAGKVEFRVDKAGIVHAPIGKTSFDHARLEENAAAFIRAVQRAKPPAAKGKYFRTVSISSTMGPGVEIDTASIEA